MSQDQLYSNEAAPEGPFEFSAAVAEVFPDMLRRSIPGYAASIDAIRSLAQVHAQADTRLYDLGCSLGAAASAMRQGVCRSGCRILAVDSAPAMVSRCRALLEASDDQVNDKLNDQFNNQPKHRTPIDVECADIRDTPIENASMVVMNYTLQFLPPADRAGLLARIAEGLRPGGLLLLSEKVVDPDPQIEAVMQSLHMDFKRRHAYSELEIARKRAALENVLIPDSVATHRDRMVNAGFTHVAVWLRHFNFVSMIGIR